MSDLRKAVQDFLTHWDSPQWTDTAKTVAAISVMRKALAETEQSEPYGRVTVVKRPGCADMHWFYRHPEPPYLDNAAECHTVYTAAPPRREPLKEHREVMQMALDALESTHDVGCTKTDAAIKALEEALK